MANRILLAEDDPRLAQLVKDYLEDNEFQILIEEQGHRISKQIDCFNPNLVILDIMLPGKDGMTVCKEIRPHFNGPILMLTARDGDADQVLGLEFGADDYVIKPVEPRILLARIRALLRRYNTETQQESALLGFGVLSIDGKARRVLLHGRVIDLSSHEFDLLTELAKQAGQVMSRELLLNQVYGRAYDGMDRTIDVRISQLRKKLGDSANNPFRIKTVWGRGYLFVPDAWKE